MVDFNEAVDVLVGPPIITKLAEEAGVKPGTISHARMLRRSPPPRWSAIVCRLLDERIEELTALRRALADA